MLAPAPLCGKPRQAAAGVGGGCRGYTSGLATATSQGPMTLQPPPADAASPAPPPSPSPSPILSPELPPAPPPSRAAITAAWALDETAHVREVLATARQPFADWGDLDREAIHATAADLVRRVRARAADQGVI